MAPGIDPAVHREGQRQARPIAALKGVASDQPCPERIEHRANPRQGLEQQLLLQGRLRLRQGHQGLHTLQICPAGPEIAAGMKSGEAGIEPGVAHQGREAIHALEQQGAIGGHGQHRRILHPVLPLIQGRGAGGGRLRPGHPLQPGQGTLQRSGSELRGATAAGHRLRPHRSQGGEALQEALIQVALPAPQPAAGPQGNGPPEQHGPRPLRAPAPIPQQLQRPPLGPPRAKPPLRLLQAALEIGGEHRRRPHRPHPRGRPGRTSHHGAVAGGEEVGVLEHLQAGCGHHPARGSVHRQPRRRQPGRRPATGAGQIGRSRLRHAPLQRDAGLGEQPLAEPIGRS